MKRRDFFYLSTLATGGLLVGCESMDPIALDDGTVVRASRFGTLREAMAEIGNEPTILLLDPGSTLLLDEDDEIPGNVTIKAAGGLIILGEFNLIIGGRLIAPEDIRIFEISRSGSMTFTQPQIVSPQNFGAMADGRTPCDAEIQAAQDSIGQVGGSVKWPAGTYLCRSSIFLYGRVSWLADSQQSAEIVVDGFESRGSQTAFLAIGVNRTIRTGVRWTGKFSGFRFTPGPNKPSGGNLINVFDAEDYEISHNLFEGFITSETAIKGANQNEWVEDDFNARRRGRYLYNTIHFDQSGRGGEGISISGLGRSNPEPNAEDILIHGNIIIGTGDDPIATHSGVQNVVISQNVCRTQDGRIACFDTDRLNIESNQVEQISTDGGVALIELAWESAQPEIARGASEGIVANNILSIRQGQNIPQAIFIRGAHDILVQNNIIHNESDDVTRIRLTVQQHLNMQRKYGRITVRDNQLFGGAIDATGGAAHQDDWVIFGPNVTDGRGKFQNLIRSVGNLPGSSVYLSGITNVIPTATHIAQIRVFVTDANRLSAWNHAALPDAGTTELVFAPGLEELTLDEKGFVAVEVRISVSTPVAGDVTVEITEDGVPIHTVPFGEADGYAQARYTDGENAELSRKEFGKGRRVGVRVLDPLGHAAGRSIEVEVIGVRMNALARS